MTMSDFNKLEPQEQMEIFYRAEIVVARMREDVLCECRRLNDFFIILETNGYALQFTAYGENVLLLQ